MFVVGVAIAFCETPLLCCPWSIKVTMWLEQSLQTTGPADFADEADARCAAVGPEMYDPRSFVMAL
jgi:hypothetical protein